MASFDTATRRGALHAGLAGVFAAGCGSVGDNRAQASSSLEQCADDSVAWGKTAEGKRSADLGNGRYRNPVLGGDHPDPSVLKDGKTYYKVSSSFDYYPGLLIWQSGDLVNWTPVGPALHKPVGSVYAPDLVKHDGRYFIYFPAVNRPIDGVRPYGKGPTLSTFVIHAQDIAGPWSDPVNLDLSAIDPGHVVGEDGERYLFLNEGRRVRLTPDGLARDGAPEKVYDGWPIPSDWIFENPALEGPKLLRRGEWFYMFSAQGGTGGPPTGHMVIAARSRSIHGPWENAPGNPIVRSRDNCEPWWSRGHATAVEGPSGDWWLVYHGYENGYRTRGRQMLLEPLVWDKDGWPVARGGDLSRPLPKPNGGTRKSPGWTLSDDFSHDRFGTNLSFFLPGPNYSARAVLKDGALVVQATGSRPDDGTLLLLNAPDRAYCVTIDVEVDDTARAGLLLFYDRRFHAGIASDAKRLHSYKAGAEQFYPPLGPGIGRRFRFRMVNDHDVASFHIADSGDSWTPVRSFEVSGYNHNVADGFLSLRPAIFASGNGQASFRNLIYSAI